MCTVREVKFRTYTRAADVRIYWRRQRIEELRNLYSLNTYHQIVYVKNEVMNRASSVHGANEKSIQNVRPKT
jgi:hypothetical protein